MRVSHKCLFDGFVDRYKTRIVVKGFHQRLRVDYHDTFSMVFKPTFVRLILSLETSRGWALHQLDVNNAFLQGTLSKDVYMSQSSGFVDRDSPHFVCNSIRPFMASRRPPMLGTVNYLSTYFMLAFPTLRHIPLCSSIIMAIAPSIF